MTQKRLFSTVLFIAAFLNFKSQTASAQTSSSLFWEPELEVEISTDENWTYSFGVANRTIYYEKVEGNKISGENQEHLELNHFTGYRISENSEVALGIRYRFVETFNEGGHDELRFIQQFHYGKPEAFMDLGHRFRFEQRFREETEFRTRYQIGIGQDLGENFTAGLATEILYSFGPQFSPELDQRFSIEIANTSFRNLEITAGFEYQYENYLNTPNNELFILSGLTLDL